MNYTKKTSWFIVLFTIHQLINCSEDQATQDIEFPHHTTEKYMYNKSITTQDHSSLYTTIFGKHPNGISITDTTSEDLLSNRVTRKRVEIRTENGVSISTTETWTSRNPSYLTWINGAIVIAAIASIALHATAINSLGNIAAAGINSRGNIEAAGINSRGNIEAAEVNSRGNIETAQVNSRGNLTTVSSPTTSTPSTETAPRKQWY